MHESLLGAQRRGDPWERGWHSRGMAVGKGAVSNVWLRDSSVGGRGAGGWVGPRTKGACGSGVLQAEEIHRRGLSFAVGVLFTTHLSLISYSINWMLVFPLLTLISVHLRQAWWTRVHKKRLCCSFTPSSKPRILWWGKIFKGKPSLTDFKENWSSLLSKAKFKGRCILYWNDSDRTKCWIIYFP